MRFVLKLAGAAGGHVVQTGRVLAKDMQNPLNARVIMLLGPHNFGFFFGQNFIQCYSEDPWVSESRPWRHLAPLFCG